MAISDIVFIGTHVGSRFTYYCKRCGYTSPAWRAGDMLAGSDEPMTTYDARAARTVHARAHKCNGASQPVLIVTDEGTDRKPEALKQAVADAWRKATPVRYASSPEPANVVELLRAAVGRTADPFKDGDVIRWTAYSLQADRSYVYAALRAGGKWWRTGTQASPYDQGVRYSMLIEYLGADNVSDISVATSWSPLN